MKKNSCFTFIIIIIAIIAVFNIMRCVKVGSMPLSQKIASYIAIPFVATGNAFTTVGENIHIFFANKTKVNRELAQLRQENSILRQKIEDLKPKAENTARLEKIMQFREATVFDSKGARLLYFSPSHWYKEAVIDIGEKEGVKPGFVALTEEGIIGQITAVSKHTSVIESITCENTAIGGMITRSHIKGLVIGDGSKYLQMTYLKSTSDIKKGDTVCTGGDGSLIPTGIPIGKVTEVKIDKLTNSATATIKPFCDFNNIDIFLVVISKSPLLGDSE